MISKTDTFMFPFISSSFFPFPPPPLSPLAGLKKDSSILNCLKNWQQSHPSSTAKRHKYRGVENPGFVNFSSHTRLFKSELYVGLEVDLQENSLKKLLVPHNNIFAICLENTVLLAWFGFSGEDNSFKVKVPGCKLKIEWALRETTESYSQFHDVLLNLTCTKDPIFYVLL